MKKYNIWKNSEPSLETHKDERGTIADIFYNSNINHVAIIESKPQAIRGNHYHKLTTQYVYVIKGQMEYWHKSLDSEEEAEYVVLNEGDIVKTPPYEVHSFRILTYNQFMVFSEGLRGGKDYEKDTYAYDPPLVQKLSAEQEV